MYERLQKLNLTMSHVVTNRLLTKCGVDHDARVKEWCAEFAACLKQEHVDVCYSGFLCVNTCILPTVLAIAGSPEELCTCVQTSDRILRQLQLL